MDFRRSAYAVRRASRISTSSILLNPRHNAADTTDKEFFLPKISVQPAGNTAYSMNTFQPNIASWLLQPPNSVKGSERSQQNSAASIRTTQRLTSDGSIGTSQRVSSAGSTGTSQRVSSAGSVSIRSIDSGLGSRKSSTCSEDKRHSIEDELEVMDLSDSDDDKEDEDVYLGERVYQLMCKKCRVQPIQVIMQNLRTSAINIQYRALIALDIKPLALALLTNAYVTSINLTGNQIGNKGALYIAEVLRENVFIKELDLSANELKDPGLEDLCDVIRCSDTLESLSLSGNNLDDTQVRWIANMIQDNSSLEELDLSHNQFGHQSGHALGKALASNISLTSLNMSWNQLRLNGGKQFCLALKENRDLRILNLRFNGLSTEGCSGLEEALTRNQTLRELDISHNRIGPPGLVYLLQGLQKNREIQILKMGDNPIPVGHVPEILTALKQNADSAIMELDLTHIAVDNNFHHSLEELQKTRSISVTHDVTHRHTKEVKVVKAGKVFSVEDAMMLLLKHTKEKNLRLLDIFHCFDEDGSLSVDKDEFKKGLMNAGINIPERQLDAVIARLDLDGDGEIDFMELMEGHKKVKRKFLQQHLKEKEEQANREKRNRTPKSSECLPEPL